jgi:hypothetical protein
MLGQTRSGSWTKLGPPKGTRDERSAGLTPSAETAFGTRGEKSYLTKVYRSAIRVSVLGAAVAVASSGLPGLIGFVVGAALALASVRIIQLIVCHVMRPGEVLMLERLLLLNLLKLPLLIAALVGVAWLVMNHIASPFALAVGVGLVPGVMFWGAVEDWLASVLPAYPAETDPTPLESRGFHLGKVC